MFDASASKINYDVIVKSNLSRIKPLNSHSTEFEIDAEDLEIAFSSSLKNWVQEVKPTGGKLTLTVKETVYPMISFSATIGIDKSNDNYTEISIKSLLEVPDLGTFGYLWFIFLYLIIVLFIAVWVGLSFAPEFWVQYKDTPKVLHIIHSCYIIMIIQLITSYIADYYGNYLLMKSFLIVLWIIMMMVITASPILLYDSSEQERRAVLVSMLICSTVYSILFLFIIYDFFWNYILTNFWAYALTTNLWMIKFVLNFIWKWRESTVFIANIAISIVIWLFQIVYFKISSYDGYLSIFKILIMIFYACSFYCTFVNSTS